MVKPIEGKSHSLIDTRVIICEAKNNIELGYLTERVPIQANLINMAEDVIRRFERVLGDVSDRLDRLDTLVANLHIGQLNARKPGRREPRVEIHDDCEY